MNTKNKIILLLFIGIMMPSCKDFGCQITDSCPKPDAAGKNPCNCVLINTAQGAVGTAYTYSCSRAAGTKNYRVEDSAQVPADERDAAAVKKCQVDH